MLIDMDLLFNAIREANGDWKKVEADMKAYLQAIQAMSDEEQSDIWYNPDIMPYVITCGDEGVQINEGTRLGVVGSGLKLAHFSQIVKAMKKTLGQDLRVVASAENDWTKSEFQLDDFEQTDATMQQQVEAMADKETLLYSGFLPFADPKNLKHEIKGHMVRPKGIHIANKISFTLGGGEQTYNLGNYVISADWVSAVSKEIVKEVMQTQIKFYQQLAKTVELKFVFENAGELGEKIAAKNMKMLESVGIKASQKNL